MNITRWLSAVFILLVVILGLGFIKFGQIQAAIAFAESFPEPSASVVSTYAQTSEYTKTTKVIGQVKATKTLTISNEYPGAITLVGFKPGDVVDQDQVLLKIDSSVEQANLAAAKARLTLASKTLQRFKKLVDQNRISQDEVDRAEAEVAVAQAEIDNLQVIIAKKVIKAPFAGRIDLSQYQVGQLLDANSQIAQLIGIGDEIWVDFSIPQTLTQLSVGDEVQVTLSSSNTAEVIRTARVIAKHASLDANSRQQTYRALLDNSEQRFIHNQIVNVVVPTQQRRVVMVPTNAVTRSHFGEFVYQLVKDEAGNWRAKPVKVELGDKVQDMQVVLSGLTGSELIASEGAFKLRENILVYTQEPELTAAIGGK